MTTLGVADPSRDPGRGHPGSQYERIPPAPALWRDRLAGAGAKLLFAPSQRLFEQGSAAQHVFQLMSGLACTTNLMIDGRRQIGRFLYEGDFFGLEDGIDHHFSVEALTTVVALRIPKTTVAMIADSDPQFGRYLREVASEALVAAYDRLVVLGRRTALERIAWFLLEMAERSTNPGRIDIPMSRMDIADYLGLTTETVCRAFAYFKDLGAVHLTDIRSVDRFDAELLTNHADGFFSDANCHTPRKRASAAAGVIRYEGAVS